MEPVTRWEKWMRGMFKNALKTTRGNVTHAARWLGISRPMMQRQMRRYDLTGRSAGNPNWGKPL